jgi:hypothetical protein
MKDDKPILITVYWPTCFGTACVKVREYRIGADESAVWLNVASDHNRQGICPNSIPSSRVGAA